MARTGRQEIYEAFRTAARTGVYSWGTRVSLVRIRAGVVRPYLFIYHVGGHTPAMPNLSAEWHIFGVMCVADTLTASLAGEAELVAIFADNGQGEGGAISGVDWEITNITKNAPIGYVDEFEEADPRYYDGWQFDVLVQER